jgi:hypothetical protein
MAEMMASAIVGFYSWRRDLGVFQHEIHVHMAFGLGG